MQRAHRKAHTIIWRSIAILLPMALAFIYASQPKLAPDAPAIRLDTGSGGKGAMP